MSTEAAPSATVTPSGPSAPTPFRIFLAAPGDLAHERMIVREVVDQLRLEPRLHGRLTLELIAGDQPDAAAIETAPRPRDAIAPGLPWPADCDLVIVVLWDRMGASPPPGGTRPDGSPLLSGIEWVYATAAEGFSERGRPHIWLFHRHPAPKVDLDDPGLDDKRAQLRKVGAFFRALRNADGSIGGGVHGYRTPDDFRRELGHLLRDHLKAVAAVPDAAADDRASAQSPAMTGADATSEQADNGGVFDGEPAPGIAAFTPEQAQVFYGRGAETDQLLALLADPGTRFAAVVGLAGCGKSSLVTDGLIPRLHAGLIGGAPWRDLRFTPAECGPDPFLALATALKQALPAGHGAAADLAADLRAEPRRLGLLTQALLNGRPNGAELLLFMDQFEELFTRTDPALVRPFVDLIARAVETPRLRVIVALRADCYAAAVAEPGLVALLRRDRGSFPLDPPAPAAQATSAAPTAVIERPARAARRPRARRGLVITGLAGVAMALLGILGYLWHQAVQPNGYPPLLLARGLAIDLGLGRLPEPLRLLPDPDMVPIRGGRFRMGDIAGGGFDDERPVHARNLAPFSIGRHEVSFAEYDLFAAATGRPRPNDEGWGRGDRPVINVSWDEAAAYAAWLAERTGQPYRLPTEAEWEYAARAGTEAASWFEATDGTGALPCRFVNGQDRTFDASGYWSRDDKDAFAGQGMYAPADCADGYVATAPVGSLAPNPWGLHDMLGNVWEWVADCYAGYADVPGDDAPAARPGEQVAGRPCDQRLLRGGSWINTASNLRVSTRLGGAPDAGSSYGGLRLARQNLSGQTR